MKEIITEIENRINQKFSESTTVSSETTPNLSLLSITAKKKSKRPLSKLQYMLLLIIKDDCRIQKYCDRSIKEFANITGHSRHGVIAALAVLNEKQFIFTKKQTRGYNSVRAISREGILYKPDKIKKNKNCTPQSTPQRGSIPYRVSSSSKNDNSDLLKARDSIDKTCRREEECFKALNFSELDELIILTALKRHHFCVEARFTLATQILHANYKRPIQHKRAYYMTAIENYLEGK